MKQQYTIIEIEEAIKEAKELCHPLQIGLTEQDKKEIKAYNTGLNNLFNILLKK